MTPALAIGQLRKYSQPISEEWLDLEWLYLDKRREEGSLIVELAAKRFFAAQAREVLANIRRIDLPKYRDRDPKLVFKDDLIVQRLLNVEKWDRVLRERFSPAVVKAIRDGFETSFEQVGITGISFTQNLPEAKVALRDVMAKTQGINKTTQERLGHIVDDWVTTVGANEDDLVGAIRKAYKGFTKARARLVGRTTGGASFQSGQNAGFKSAGVETHRWLSSRDDDVRAGPDFNHVAADGEEVAVEGGIFIKTGEGLRYPLDPNGSAGNVIGCRCGAIPVIRQPLVVNPIEEVDAPERTLRDFGKVDPNNKDAYGRVKEVMSEERDYWRTLSTTKKNAYKTYKDNDYADINRAMRGIEEKPTARVKKLIKNLEEVIDNAPGLSNDTVLYRGSTKESLGFSIFDDPTKKDFDRLLGTVVEDKALLSTSVDSKTSMDFARRGARYGESGFLFRIKAPKGTKAMSIYENGTFDSWEYEKILKGGTRVQINGIEKMSKANWESLTDEPFQQGFYIVDAEVI